MSKKPPEIMKKQDAAERSRNFKEVALGYSEEQALNEARRCLKCKKTVMRRRLSRSRADP